MTAGIPEPTIAVILPTYNRCGIVAEAIDSVLAQTRPADEIIVIDDGSTDRTAAHLARFGDRIRVIRQANAGVSAARNAGMRAATAQWIAFIDSDDVWMPRRLEVFLRDLAAAPVPPVGHSANIRMTGPGYERELFELRGWQAPAGTANSVPVPLGRIISGVFPTATIVRRDAALSEGGFPEDISIHEDTAFFSGVSLRGGWLFTGDIVAEVRRLPSDEQALSDLDRKRPLEAARAKSGFLCALLQRPDLPASARSLVRARASGALLKQAAHEPRAKAIGNLVKSARLHPRPWVGWGKAAIAAIAGKAGIRLLERRTAGFSRSRR